MSSIPLCWEQQVFNLLYRFTLWPCVKKVRLLHWSRLKSIFKSKRMCVYLTFFFVFAHFGDWNRTLPSHFPFCLWFISLFVSNSRKLREQRLTSRWWNTSKRQHLQVQSRGGPNSNPLCLAGGLVVQHNGTTKHRHTHTDTSANKKMFSEPTSHLCADSFGSMASGAPSCARARAVECFNTFSTPVPDSTPRDQPAPRVRVCVCMCVRPRARAYVWI